MPNVNNAAKQSMIRDEQGKLDHIKHINNFVKDIRILLGKSLNTKTTAKDSVQGMMASSSDKIVNAINLLTGELKKMSVITSSAKEDTQLTDIINSKENTLETVTPKKAIAEAAIIETRDILKDFSLKSTANNKEIIGIEKAKLANEEAIQNAKRTEALIGNNQLKETVSKDKKVEKAESPKFPFNFSKFMSSLGKILTSILNPVSMVVGLISHFLPYVILGYIFFKTLWANLSKEAKKMFIDWGIKIGKVALLIFAVFKGPALLIKSLTLVRHIAYMGYLSMKWVKDMILWSFNMSASTTEHSLKISSIIFSKMLAIIEHGMEIALKAFKFTLAILEYALIAAGVLLVIAAIVLLIAGIIKLFIMFSDKITAAVGKIISIFKEIAGMIYTSIISTVKLLVDTITTLVSGIVSGLVKGIVSGFNIQKTASNEQKDVNAKPEKVETANGVTLASFNTAINRIIEPLNLMTVSIASLAQAEMMKAMNPINVSFGAMTAAATLITNMVNKASTINADKTENSINVANLNNKKEDKSDYERAVKNDLHGLIVLLQKIEQKMQDKKYTNVLDFITT